MNNIKSGTYEALVGDSRTGAVQPRLLITVSGSYKGRSSHLLGIEAESHIARTVLALWNGARNCFGDEAVSLLYISQLNR
jgi:hypothetical protein